MFDLKAWVREVDISGADESLDKEAARLLVLNDALVNNESGPILCALIITAEAGKGLDALVELADCSEPRLAMMAVVNLLNTLSEDNLENCEFSLPTNVDSSEGPDLTIRSSDFPSDELVQARAVPATVRLADLFLKRVAAGDFCCDFLTFLLTALMDLSVKCRKRSPDLFLQLSTATDETFLKTIMRTWKASSQHLHRSESEGDASLNLGFLVSCYLQSLVLSREEQTRIFDETSSESSDEESGLLSLIKLGDWGIKFVLMRIYSSSSTETERAHLFSVLQDCAKRDTTYGVECLRQSTLTALSYAGNSPLLSLMQSNRMLSIEETAVLKETVTSQVLFLITLVNVVTSEHVTPGTGIWLDNKQSKITMELATALSAVGKRALQLVILAQFPLTAHGQLQRKMVTSVVSKLLSVIWKTSLAVLFREYRQSLQLLRRAFQNVLRDIGETTEQICPARGTMWSQLCANAEMAPLRIGVAACKRLAITASEWDAERLDISHPQLTLSSRIRSSRCICEHCLELFSTPKACARCGAVKYCSIEHQRAHWEKGHKSECLFLRNCLEGTSVTVSNGRLQGLFRIRNDSGRMAFSSFMEGQRQELLILSFRLPGLMEEKVGGGVRYLHFAQKMREVAAYVNAGLLSEADLSAVWALMQVCDNSCMLYSSRSEDSMTLSLISSGDELSQSFSVALSFTREIS